MVAGGRSGEGTERPPATFYHPCGMKSREADVSEGIQHGRTTRISESLRLFHRRLRREARDQSKPARPALSRVATAGSGTAVICIPQLTSVLSPPGETS